MSDNQEQEWFEGWFDSRFYHLLYGHRSDKEAETFIDLLVDFLSKHIDVQHAEVLDLACGAGRHARALQKNVAGVCGIDLSPESIETAILTGPPDVEYHVRDMREIKLDRTFDLIVNLFTSFGYFKDFDDNRKVLSEVYNHLRKDGIFVLDFMNVHFVTKHLRARENVVKKGVSFDLHRGIEEGYIVKDIRFEVNGKSHHHQERVQMLEAKDLVSMVENASMEVLDCLGNYALEAFDENRSERVILIARKR